MVAEIWKYIKCQGTKCSTTLVYNRCICVNSLILPMQILKQEVSIRYENDPHYFCYNHKIVFLLLFLFDQAHLTSSIAAQRYFSLLGIHSFKNMKKTFVLFHAHKTISFWYGGILRPYYPINLDILLNCRFYIGIAMLYDYEY